MHTVSSIGSNINNHIIIICFNTLCYFYLHSVTYRTMAELITELEWWRHSLKIIILKKSIILINLWLQNWCPLLTNNINHIHTQISSCIGAQVRMNFSIWIQINYNKRLTKSKIKRWNSFIIVRYLLNSICSYFGRIPFELMAYMRASDCWASYSCFQRN